MAAAKAAAQEESKQRPRFGQSQRPFARNLDDRFKCCLYLFLSPRDNESPSILAIHDSVPEPGHIYKLPFYENHHYPKDNRTARQACLEGSEYLLGRLAKARLSGSQYIDFGLYPDSVYVRSSCPAAWSVFVAAFEEIPILGTAKVDWYPLDELFVHHLKPNHSLAIGLAAKSLIELFPDRATYLESTCKHALRRFKEWDPGHKV